MAEEQVAVDWVAAFPPEPTNLESLSFECYELPVAFAALEALVARSPRLSRLGVNLHVSLGQLRRLMAHATRLSHLAPGLSGRRTAARRGSDSLRFSLHSSPLAEGERLFLSPASVTSRRSTCQPSPWYAPT